LSRETVKKLLIVVIIVVVIISTMALVDTSQIVRGLEPRFIINSKTYDYNNIVINEYTGLGYKIIKYDSVKDGVNVRFGTLFLTK
jgi:hypothetical protein